jgi:hypothetical protein
MLGRMRQTEESGHESLVKYKLAVSGWKKFQRGSTQESFEKWRYVIDVQYINHIYSTYGGK